jgi:uncharacterized membrane protein
VKLQFKITLLLIIIWTTAFSPLFPYPQVNLEDSDVVRAVLFYSPTCPACHRVITEIIPPLFQKHQNQLQVIGIDVSQQAGQELYQIALNTFQIPDERVGVPTLVIGQQVLVGSDEIRDLLPGIIDQGLVNGGISWPEIPGLDQALKQTNPNQPENDRTPVQTTVLGSMAERFMLDPIANSIAVIVLVVMLISIVVVGNRFLTGKVGNLVNWPTWLLPLLSLIGLFVALYLSYVEITHTEVICGPVGNCNSVQQSRYAYLFDIIPVGLMGVFGYLAILVGWLIQQFGPFSLRKFGSLGIWGMAWIGVLFSIYLTFLEPFIIGATCAWCIISAIVMTLILWASTGPALEAMQIHEVDSDFEEIDIDDGELEELEFTDSESY